MQKLETERLHAAFDSVVAPLEQEAGKRLTGPARATCRAAFSESPEGFEALAADALGRSTINPIGLLVRMVKDGDLRAVIPGRWEVWRHDVDDDGAARREQLGVFTTEREARSQAKELGAYVTRLEEQAA